MSGNADRFAKDVEVEFAQVLKTANLEANLVALQVLDGCIRETAVRTGRARGNWMLGSDPAEIVPNEDAIDFAPQGAPPGIGQMTDAQATLAGMKPFSTKWVGNGLEYISYLEDGTPLMGARPMVAPTLARVEAQFK